MKKQLYIRFILILCFAINLNINLLSVKNAEGCKIQKIMYTEHINVSGEFENLNSTDLVLSYPLYIKDVLIKENQYVNQGQSLFTVDKDKMISLLNSDISDIGITEISGLNLNELKKMKITEENLLSVPDTIYSPSDGLVKNLFIKPSCVYIPGKTLLTISSKNDYVAKFTVSQPDFGRIKVGDNVEISPVAFDDKVYNGVITDRHAVVKTEASVTGSKVVIDVYADIDNPDKMITGGLQINGKIQNGNAVEINVLDHSYINQDEYGEYVFILRNGIADKVYISTGIETETMTQVTTPFDENTVFIKGEIAEGDRVVIR